MKKEDLASLFVYAIIFVATIVFGIVVINGRTAVTNLTTATHIVYVIGALLVGVIFNAILFELAHLLGAKIGRYKVLSVNILYFNFYRDENDKWKFRFKSFDGLVGETKIVPNKDAKKEPSPTAYLTLGSLIYLIEAIVGVTLFVLFVAKKDPTLADIAYFILIVIFVGLMIFLYNIVPLKLDSANDGYRLTLVSNPKNKVAFNELLRVENEIANGNKDVEIKVFDEITNFTADLNLNKVYLLLNAGKYDEAEPLIEKIIEAKKDVSEKVYNDAISQLIFIKFMTMPFEDANAAINGFANEEIKREISKCETMVTARAYILLAGLVDKSKSECILTINNIKSAFKHTKKTRQDIEIDLFNLALDKVISEHPSWEFEQYRLVSKKKEENNEEAKPNKTEENTEKPCESPVKPTDKPKE